MTGVQERDGTRDAWRRETFPDEIAAWSLVPGFPMIPLRAGPQNTDMILTTDRPNNWACQARFATEVRDSAHRAHQIIFLIDGSRKALQALDFLDRRGACRSGMKFNDFRGIIFAVEGIPVEYYSGEKLLERTKYAVLQLSADKAKHFVLFINGDFTVTPNRNGITPADVRRLEGDTTFKSAFERFLDSCVDEDSEYGRVFKNVLQRFNNERSAQQAQREHEFQLERKADMLAAHRFTFRNLPGSVGAMLNGKIFLEPAAG